MGQVNGSKQKALRRQHLHVTVDADLRKRVRDLRDRSGKTESDIVDQALHDALNMWEDSRQERATIGAILLTIQERMEDMSQQILLLVAKQNLDAALAFPATAPMRLPRAPENWQEWQGTLLRIRAQLEQGDEKGKR